MVVKPNLEPTVPRVNMSLYCLGMVDPAKLHRINQLTITSPGCTKVKMPRSRTRTFPMKPMLESCASILVPILISNIIKHPFLWRFVGIASSTVGLLCYALSSSFQHLYGNWTFLKIILYCVVSLIISFIMLFPEKLQKLQFSRIFRLESHVVFLVFILTSLYSVFYDESVHGKPDVLSLISNGAFTLMSLSLSRQIQLGFESGLFSFFLGNFVVQLIKINLVLTSVIAVFSYLLIALRSYMDWKSEIEHVSDDDQLAIEIGTKNEASFDNLTSNERVEIGTSEILTELENLIRRDPAKGAVPGGELHPITHYLMSYFREACRSRQTLEQVLEENGLQLEDYDIVIDALPSMTVNDLHEMVKLLVGAGFGKECCHVYSSCRRDFLDESLSWLGLQKFSIEEVHMMPWQQLEEEIEKWTKASKVALRILFPSERRLCERVFSGFASMADLSFVEVCRESTIQLLNFADAVAIGSLSPERLFRILDLFETLRDLMAQFEALFSDEHCMSLRNEAITIWKRLGQAIRGIFMELENLIQRDPAEAAVPGGGLHPITRYVMNYLRAACRSQQTLEQVFEENGLESKDCKILDDKEASSSSLSVQMAWIMELLESNLEAKSKVYKDSALCYVFLMNNGRYIVQKVKDCELGVLLGDDWIRKHTAKVRQYHVNYQRSSWNEVLNLLKVSGGPSAPNVAAKSLKEKLKSFNMQFEEICRVQSTWFVFDEQLRQEIRIYLEKILLPAYGSFITRFQNFPEFGKHADRYIKYAVEDIEARIDGLFQGSGGTVGSRKWR